MEMKKSYSPFGSTPLSVDEVLPDIQTGRAVYPDKDKEADASYMERINQYKHEGFHDASEGGGGSSGGGSSSGWGTALIIREERTEETSDAIIIYYDKTYQEVKDAYDAGLPIYLQRYTDESGGFERLPLILVSDPTSGNYRAKVFDIANSVPQMMLASSADGQLFSRSRK